MPLLPSPYVYLSAQGDNLRTKLFVCTQISNNTDRTTRKQVEFVQRDARSLNPDNTSITHILTHRKRAHDFYGCGFLPLCSVQRFLTILTIKIAKKVDAGCKEQGASSQPDSAEISLAVRDCCCTYKQLFCQWACLMNFGMS